ncbi:MAG: ATP-binding protein, partial [Pseudomonadota bacterium]
EPLRSIRGYARLLESDYLDALDEQGKDFLSRVLRSAERMQHLIDDLLQFASVESDETLRFETDIGQIVNEAQDELEQVIASSGAAVSVGPMPTARVNSRQMVMVFHNLIENAIKYRGGEPPNVEISARENSEHWTVCVADNGRGIDRRHWMDAFNIFTRVDAESRLDGTGVGLALVKKIVERHEGEVWMTSQVGIGTKIFFTLPK